MEAAMATEQIYITGENITITRPTEIKWRSLDEPPEEYGYYRVLARVFGEVVITYSCWTGHQWANCYPVQERLGWAYPPGR